MSRCYVRSDSLHTVALDTSQHDEIAIMIDEVPDKPVFELPPYRPPVPPESERRFQPLIATYGLGDEHLDAPNCENFCAWAASLTSAALLVVVIFAAAGTVKQYVYDKGY